MTLPLPPVAPGVVLVAPASPKGGTYGEGAPSLVPGQTIYFRVLPASAAGEIRLRIGAHTLTAAGQRALPEGSSGTAVVKGTGPPIILQVTELRTAALAEPLRLPVLLGREPLGNAASLLPGTLEKWNRTLQGQLASEAAGMTPERVREGILLSRAVVSALVLHAGGETILKRLTGMNRGTPSPAAPAADAGERAASRPQDASGDAQRPARADQGPDRAPEAPPRPGRPMNAVDLSAREAATAPVGLGKPQGPPSAKTAPAASPSGKPSPSPAVPSPSREAGRGPAAKDVESAARQAGGGIETPRETPSDAPPDLPGRPMNPADLSAWEVSKAPVGLGKPQGTLSAKPVPTATPSGKAAPAASTASDAPARSRTAGEGTAAGGEGKTVDPAAGRPREIFAAGRGAASPSPAPPAMHGPGERSPLIAPPSSPTLSDGPPAPGGRPAHPGMPPAAPPDAWFAARGVAGEGTRQGLPAPGTTGPGAVPQDPPATTVVPGAGAADAPPRPPATQASPSGPPATAFFGEPDAPRKVEGRVPAAGLRGGETADRAADPAPVPKGAPETAAPAADESPFWFFIPFPGEKTPVLFPGYRRRPRGGNEASWNIFLRLPDLGAVCVRFRQTAGGWRLEFSAEHEPFVRALLEASGAFTETLRARGFSVREVVVRRVPGGQMEAEVGAALSADLGIPLVERRA